MIDNPSEFLRALFGYTSQPEVITLLVWVTYVVVVLTLYLRPVKPRSARPAVVAGPGTAA